MNWKVKLVLAFSNLNKPIEAENEDIAVMRKRSSGAARLGTRLFDSFIPIKVVKDVSYDGLPMRLYRNSDTPNQRVIVYYHGGGFVLYGLDSHDNVCRRLCRMNECMVVAVDYRLAPEHSFPAAHEDAFRGLQWVRQHISEYGGNENDLIVMGDSAGGNLAACMALRCRKENIPLKAQVMIYPWIDGKLDNASIIRNGEGYMLTRPTMFWFQRQYTPRVEDRCVPTVSPCYETDLKGLAPAYILTAEFDPLVDDGYKYYLQLKENGNTVSYKEYEGLVHGFFNIPKVDREAMQAYIDIVDFLSKIE